MTITTKKALKHLISLKQVKLLFVILIILLPTAFLLFTHIQLREVKKEITDIKNDQRELNTIVNDYKDVTSAFYQEYQETGLLTVEVIEATVEKMNSAIDVYDENVEIYNNQIQDLYEKTDNLNRRVKIISDYLLGN